MAPALDDDENETQSQSDNTINEKVWHSYTEFPLFYWIFVAFSHTSFRIPSASSREDETCNRIFGVKWKKKNQQLQISKADTDTRSAS